MDIQNQLLEQLKTKIPADSSLGKVLMEELDLSRDSAYRRARGETALKPEEIQLLCSKYDLSIDKIVGISGKNVIFQYNPLQRGEFSFNTYLSGILDAFKRMTSQRSFAMYASNMEISMFQIANFPELLRFKLLYFAKCYLNLPSLRDVKYKKGWKDGIPDDMVQEILRYYVKVPTTEVMHYEVGKGLIREIVSFYELGFFESKEDALILLEQAKELFKHLEEQCVQSRKFIVGKPVTTEQGNYMMYLHPTYLQDNTFISETNAYRMLYITHNMINYMYTIDQDYVNKSYAVFNQMIANCTLISGENSRLRAGFFDQLHVFLDKARSRMDQDALF